MTLRLTDEETELLRRTAEMEERSMQEVARAAIRKYMTRRTARRDAALARILAEDRAPLDRLGSV